MNWLFCGRGFCFIFESFVLYFEDEDFVMFFVGLEEEDSIGDMSSVYCLLLIVVGRYYMKEVGLKERGWII